MTWSNWTSIANDVFNFFVSLVGKVLDLAFTTPVMGVPIIIGVIGSLLGVVLYFIGSFGKSNTSEK